MPWLHNSSGNFDKRHSIYPTPTYLSNSAAVSKNSVRLPEITKSAQVLSKLLNTPKQMHFAKLVSSVPIQ